MKKINIAVDGFSGCGKSTLAKLLSQELDYKYIDTGAMYRAVTLYFLQHDIDINDSKSVKKSLSKININFKYIDGVLNTFLNGQNVEIDIRKDAIADFVSQVSTISIVRKKLVQMQQEIGKNKGVVMDGRDIGTVVFPEAELKLFLTADLDIRAKRRHLELIEKKIPSEFSKIKTNLSKRDKIDSSRIDSPLMMAKDAILIDTSHISADEVRNIALNKFKETIEKY